MPKGRRMEWDLAKALCSGANVGGVERHRATRRRRMKTRMMGGWHQRGVCTKETKIEDEDCEHEKRCFPALETITIQSVCFYALFCSSHIFVSLSIAKWQNRRIRSFAVSSFLLGSHCASPFPFSCECSKAELADFLSSVVKSSNLSPKNRSFRRCRLRVDTLQIRKRSCVL